MYKLAIKKREFGEEATGSEMVDEPSRAGTSVGQTKKTAGPVKKRARRAYQDSYLEFGFTWCNGIYGVKPKCVVCGTELANEALVPSKLKRHLITKHRDLSDKNLDYFEGLLNKNKQNFTFEEKVNKGSEKAQEASYLIAQLVAKNMKPHAVAESLVLPCCCAIVNNLFGDAAENEVKQIPLSRSTIGRRIAEMSFDVEKSLCELVRERGMYALQVDESTSLGGTAKLLVYIRFIGGDKIIEQFLCCKEIPTTAPDIFLVLSEYLQSVHLTWKSCVGICTDGVCAVTNSLKRFISLVKNENPDLITTHCLLRRETLVAKTLGHELKAVLGDVVKMVNFIKSRPAKPLLFSHLCEGTETNHLGLILHTETRWLSRGNILFQILTLKEEMITFFTLEEKVEFCELLVDESWWSKLCYLADIFEHLNKVGRSAQGREETLLSCSDKLRALTEKLNLWKVVVNEGNMDMFPKITDTTNNKIIPLIYEHLGNLEKIIENYFPNINVESYDWLRNPFLRNPPNERHLSLHEQEELIDIRNNRSLELKYMNVSPEDFWIGVEDAFPHMAKKALGILLQFSSSHSLEMGFSTLASIKHEERSRLQSVEEKMRVCLSSIPPDIQRICKSSQAHLSH